MFHFFFYVSLSCFFHRMQVLHVSCYCSVSDHYSLLLHRIVHDALTLIFRITFPNKVIISIRQYPVAFPLR